jgi:hypothetical protein
MKIKTHTTPKNLEKYSFLWSELRLIIAALALFLGGIPPIFKLGLPYALSRSLLTLSWIISGLVSAYLLYLWNKNNKMLFGEKNSNDRVAFFVNIISGINLGITGLFNNNIGMGISQNKFAFIIVAVIYLLSAAYLYKRWQNFNNKLF